MQKKKKNPSVHEAVSQNNNQIYNNNNSKGKSDWGVLPIKLQRFNITDVASLLLTAQEGRMCCSAEPTWNEEKYKKAYTLQLTN